MNWGARASSRSLRRKGRLLCAQGAEVEAKRCLDSRGPSIISMQCLCVWADCLPCAAHALLTMLASVFSASAASSIPVRDSVSLTNRRHSDSGRDNCASVGLPSRAGAGVLRRCRGRANSSARAIPVSEDERFVHALFDTLTSQPLYLRQHGMALEQQ